MRRFAVVCLLAAGCEGGSTDAVIHPDSEDLDWYVDGSNFQIKFSILMDVRVRRELNLHLDQGRKEPVAPGFGVLSPHELVTYELRCDAKVLPDGVTETALYSSSAKQYFYHYVGGPRNLDVWMGPFPLELRTK